jgi:hypothetical protein
MVAQLHSLLTSIPYGGGGQSLTAAGLTPWQNALDMVWIICRKEKSLALA